MSRKIKPYLGIAFAVSEPEPLWNARLIYSIMRHLGANDPEGDFQDSVYDAMNESVENHLYAIDEETMNIVSYPLPNVWAFDDIRKVMDKVDDYKGLYISNVITGINNWIIPLHTWNETHLDNRKWNPATSSWNHLSSTWFNRECSNIMFFKHFLEGIGMYIEDHNINNPISQLTLNLNHTIVPDGFQVQINRDNDRGDNPIRYFDMEFTESGVIPSAVVDIMPQLSYPEQSAHAPMLNSYGESIGFESELKLNLERWNEPKLEAPVFGGLENTLGINPTIGHNWCKDLVYALNILWKCNSLSSDDELNEYVTMKNYCDSWFENYTEGLNNEFDLIYYPVKKEKKVKQVKNSIVMAETKKTNSFMEKMMSRFKGQFLPEKCDEFAMAWDGQIVAKCVAGTGTIYNAIVNGEIVSYPDEAVLDIPMYTILRPADKIVEGDIIVISGTSTGSRFGKVTAIKKKDSKVSSFQVIRFNGTEDGTVVAKDAIMKMGLVEVVFNPFTSKDVFQGTGMNPMMFLLMDGKGGNMQDLMMMSMMMGNNQTNMNPMMVMCLMDGKKDMKDLMMMSMMMGNKDNPFANLFGQPTVETK